MPLAQRAMRHALRNTSKVGQFLRNKAASAEARVQLEPFVARNAPRQPLHPLASLRQQKRGIRWYSASGGSLNLLSSAARRFLDAGTKIPRYVDRTAYLRSTVGSRAFQSTGRAPFASTLRPNLTGGCLPRTAGGYSLPGRTGARYFSHTPAAPAQVVQNVSQAMRAFWTSGQRARYDGVGPRGEKHYAAVSALHTEASRTLKAHSFRAAGSYVDFPLNPTITALSPLAAAFPFSSSPATLEQAATLTEEGFLAGLSSDFAQALKDLSAVLDSLRRLSALGDLPVHLEKGRRGGTVLRVRFPGVDAETVETLCDDLGLTRGLVGQDANFDAQNGAPVALRFPFAPDAEERGASTFTSPGGSVRSRRSFTGLSETEEEEVYLQQFLEDNPWLSNTEEEGYATTEEGYGTMSATSPRSRENASADYEGLEGIYRFLEECDRRPRF